jgi:hypothetical protein
MTMLDEAPFAVAAETKCDGVSQATDMPRFPMLTFYFDVLAE